MAKKRALTKEEILAKAVALADRGGLAALSMRKLAKELNIQAMSLYHHFKTKETLITHMADALVVQMDFGIKEGEGGADWRAIMIRRAMSAKSLFQKHPWLPFVLDSHLQSGAGRLDYLNQYIGTLRHAGFPIALALKVTSLIDSYIYGFCRQLSHVTPKEASFEEQAEKFSAAFNGSEYPYLNEATKWVMEKGYDENGDFLFGLNIILNGIGLELKSIEGGVYPC